MAKRALFKATMYESKLSGLRGKAAREALLEAEAQEKKAGGVCVGGFCCWEVGGGCTKKRGKKVYSKISRAEGDGV